MLGKKGTDARWKNFSNSKVADYDWKDDFRVFSQSFYEVCTK